MKVLKISFMLYYIGLKKIISHLAVSSAELCANLNLTVLAIAAGVFSSLQALSLLQSPQFLTAPVPSPV